MDQTAEPARQTARRPPATPPGSEPSVLTLQPGLMICHTTARDLAAVDAIREFPGDSEFLHMNCQLDGHIEGRIGSHPLAYARGDISLGFAAGESFQVRHCARFQNLEVMVTPVVLSELIGEEGDSSLAETPNPVSFSVMLAAVAEPGARPRFSSV